MTTSGVIALIGSFRQRYDDVTAAWRVFHEAGYEISSPLGTPITDESRGKLFVRFVTDPGDWSDPLVQLLALHRILRASLVYVVAPDGYVGRTTCYEIGRVVQARRPVYFSRRPADLPIAVPPDFICQPHDLVQRLASSRPEFFADVQPGREGEWERRLLDGDYLLD